MKKLLLNLGAVAQVMWAAAPAQAFNPVDGCFPSAVPRSLKAMNFNSVIRPSVPLEEIQKISQIFKETFAEDLARRGQVLKITLDESKTDFNAFAKVEGADRLIMVNARAMAFQAKMNPDVVGLVLCHELGHHLGGEPVVAEYDMSAEGQADYFATSKCMRRLLRTPYFQQNVQPVSLVYQSYCGAFLGRNDVADCARGLMAASVLAGITARINLQEPPAIEKSDQTRVVATEMAHPSAQCRLDTLRAGGLCHKSDELLMTRGFPNWGACLLRDSSLYEVRPACWYAPGSQWITLANEISF